MTIEELETLINQTISPQAKAMWETLYLSGIRVCELLSMKINSLQPKENGWEITIYKSKSKPRKVALPDFPENLDYWIRHHPNKNDENKPLWISESARSYGKPLTRTNAIDEKFYRDRDRAKLKKTLTPHCFRRTRATIMLKEKSKDGGVIYTDTNMADHFGWKKQSVPQRRQEYDLTGYDDLQEKVFAKSQKPITFEKVKAEYEQKLSKLEKIKEEREKDRDELNTVKNMLNRTRNEYKILNEEIKELQRNIDEVRGTYRYILTNGNPKDDISEDDELKVLRILKILKDKEIKSKNKLLPINKKERKKRLEEILKELEELINPIIQ
ncbi:MAG: tyrosine-type recombinase/integrase [Thermoplasmatales archaeon]|nr:MAG: tyrosine-type recombinase/integrase [Thermoplasmatales archaeon]